jgi:hypothetical protein
MNMNIEALNDVVHEMCAAAALAIVALVRAGKESLNPQRRELIEEAHEWLHKIEPVLPHGVDAADRLDAAATGGDDLLPPSWRGNGGASREPTGNLKKKKQSRTGVGKAAKTCAQCGITKGVAGFVQGNDVCRACEKSTGEEVVPATPQKRDEKMDQGARSRRKISQTICTVCLKPKGATAFQKGSRICHLCRKGAAAGGRKKRLADTAE